MPVIVVLFELALELVELVPVVQPEVEKAILRQHIEVEDLGQVREREVLESLVLEEEVAVLLLVALEGLVQAGAVVVPVPKRVVVEHLEQMRGRVELESLVQLVVGVRPRATSERLSAGARLQATIASRAGSLVGPSHCAAHRELWRSVRLESCQVQAHFSHCA